MAVEGIRGVVEAAIQRASQATGVDFSFLVKTAGRESGMNPKAKAPSSSAAGLFQFVEQTWLATLKQHGAKYGYGRYAALIEKGANGRYYVTGDEARRTVMDLRLHPHAASLMAGELTTDHAAYLKGRVGRTPTAGELYVAHFLGPQGSARLIEATQTRPQAAAADLFPDAARANRSIFYREGRPATVSEVYADLTSGGRGGGAAAPTRRPAAAPPVTAPSAQDQQFIQYASARRADRLRDDAALVDLVLRGSQPADRPSLTGSVFTAEMLKVLAESRKD
ncbi:MAG: transglycosylase SLT domain-containing protein [Phenylobacterium sp.]